MTELENYRYEIMRDNRDGLTMFHVTEDHGINPKQHFHGSMEFVYVAKGRILAYLGEECMEVKAGHLLALPSFLPHDLPVENAELWQLIVPRLLIGNLDKLMENKTLERRVIPDENGQLLAYLKLIYGMYTGEGLFANLDGHSVQAAAHSAAASFVRIVIQLCGLKEKAGSSSAVMQAIHYLSQHFREPIQIGNLSRMLYCNRSQLSSLFRETFGMSMNEYVTRLRAAEVRRLLDEEGITLLQACSEAGFGSLRTLHRAYKEIYGASPCESMRYPAEGGV